MFHGITGGSNLHRTRYDADPKKKFDEKWHSTQHELYRTWHDAKVQLPFLNNLVLWTSFSKNKMYHTWHDANFWMHTTLTDSMEQCSMELKSGQICIVLGTMQIQIKKLMKNDIPQNVNDGMWIWISLFWRVCVTSVTSYPVTQPKVGGQCGHAYVG